MTTYPACPSSSGPYSCIALLGTKNFDQGGRELDRTDSKHTYLWSQPTDARSSDPKGPPPTQQEKQSVLAEARRLLVVEHSVGTVQNTSCPGREFILTAGGEWASLLSTLN